jgi:murein DD-endopeptidase MepM/ murein hydrolase activator NlpD
VKSRHNGLDFGGGIGAPVKSANDGIVALTGSFYLGGNCVYVDHGAGLVTAYLHLSKRTVKVGQQVKKGQLIGRIGATGRVTGPHLHFITRYGAISVNPLSLYGVSGL